LLVGFLVGFFVSFLLGRHDGFVVGVLLGFRDGFRVGFLVGFRDGVRVGLLVGFAGRRDGLLVGRADRDIIVDVGLAVALANGFPDGKFVGRAVGFFVGRSDGLVEGFFMGRAEGFFVAGLAVGLVVRPENSDGAAVGTAVLLPQTKLRLFTFNDAFPRIPTMVRLFGHWKLFVCPDP